MTGSTVLDEARGLIQTHLSALDEEKARLEKALVALNGSAPKKGRPKGTPTRRRRRGGTRADEAVKLIAEQPGITASAIAKKMKIKPNYLYRVLSDLEKQKLVKKDGRTYTAA